MDLYLNIDDILNNKESTTIAKEEKEENLHVESIRKIIRKGILTILKGEKYQHHRIKELQTKLIDFVLSKVITLKLPFPIESIKYLVTCTIMEKKEAGFQTASSCFCDEELDRHIIYNHQEDSFFCTVNVFAFAV
ncbi:hypothetical protein K502DRAFT_363219 [Neoconidiobolus thromboides FSU 785]|nr:hypothetical protein K502DRAFT_363219 [Neoconidiobolus thromboides FSU 785]